MVTETKRLSDSLIPRNKSSEHFPSQHTLSVDFHVCNQIWEKQCFQLLISIQNYNL